MQGSQCAEHSHLKKMAYYKNNPTGLDSIDHIFFIWKVWYSDHSVNQSVEKPLNTNISTIFRVQVDAVKYKQDLAQTGFKCLISDVYSKYNLLNWWFNYFKHINLNIFYIKLDIHPQPNNV